ncbi:MAG: hypothetical protein CMJ89_08870 [Planctomycetes bacterium]|jgi:outer membrane protein assembly factor BamB|nr:hypothetical protein [Planctomycetota bacterium]
MKAKLARVAFLAASVTASLSAPATGQDWPHWRGPHFDGSAEASGLPTDFDAEERVVWAVELAGPGAATPIIVGEHVFCTAIEPEKGLLLAMCFDRRRGKALWKEAAGSNYQPGGGRGSQTLLHDRSNYASPSAVADEERVVFTFGNGDMVAFDHGGELLWRRNLQADYGDFSLQWTFSASPTLYEGKLFLPVLQRDQPANGLGRSGAESFLLAIDPASGETLYRHIRPSPAQVESLESYATMIPYVGPQGRKELLVVGGDVLTGHDPATGKELWRWGGWNAGHRQRSWRMVPSPVIGKGVALVSAPKGAPVYAVSLDRSGGLGESAVRWKSSGRRTPVTSDVPTPLYYEGHFFVLSDLRGSLSRLDPGSGSIEWSTKMPGQADWRASPTGADGKIWCINHTGLVVVVDAESGGILAEVEMAKDSGRIRASIAVAHGRLFLRTDRSLYCIGR